MADLGTTYLGFDLAHPLVNGASPLTDDLDGVRRLCDAGAPMLTLRSLLAAPTSAAEEAHLLDRIGIVAPLRSLLAGLHDVPGFAAHPDGYAEHIGRIRAHVGDDIPIVASLYARRMQDWLENAELIEQAGADALELNVYGVVLVAEYTGQTIDQRIIDIVKAVRRRIRIPVSVKLLPLYPRFEHFVQRLPAVGASGVVLFNGFYRSDLGVQALQDPLLQAMSSPLDPSYRLRWISRLSGGLGVDVAFSGGARNVEHVVQALLCGATAVQLVTVLIREGAAFLGRLRDELNDWLERHGYDSVAQLRGQLAMHRYDSLESFDLAYNHRILAGPR